MTDKTQAAPELEQIEFDRQERAEAWRPWRSYAVQHLWATGDHAVNRLPA